MGLLSGSLSVSFSFLDRFHLSYFCTVFHIKCQDRVSDVQDLEAVISQFHSSKCSGPRCMEKMNDTGLLKQSANFRERVTLLRQYKFQGYK